MTNERPVSDPAQALERRREKVARLVNAGLTERAIADELNVSRSTVWGDKQALVARRQLVEGGLAFRPERRS